MSDILVLDLGSIKGNCQITGFDDKIELLSFSHSVVMPMGMSPSNTERTTGRAVISEFTFSKMADISTTEIYQYCVMGTPIPTAKLHVGRLEGSTGAYVKLFEYEFTNVLISNVSTSGGGGIPSDSFSINFTKIQVAYTKQEATAAQKGTAAWGWDMEQVKKAGA